MANNISFVGKIRKVKNGYSEQEFNGGLIKRRLRFAAVCGNSMQFLEVSALVWKDEKKNKIYTLKSVEGGKDEKFEVAWGDRLNPDIIAKVPGYKHLVIDTDTLAHRNELKEAGETAELEKSNKKRKTFLHESDFLDHLIKVLDSEKTKNMVFKINGAVEYSYGNTKDQFYRNFVPQKIWRVEDDETQCCSGSMPLYFGANAVDDSSVDETGDYRISAFVNYYDQNARKNAFAPIVVCINKDNKKAKGFVRKFSQVEDEEIKEYGVVVEYVNGAQQVEITLDMLTDDQRQDIEDGFITLEDIQKDMGTVNGNKITEIRLVDAMKGYVSSGVKDTAYSIEDLVKKPFRDEVVEETMEDIFDENEDDDI